MSQKRTDENKVYLTQKEIFEKAYHTLYPNLVNDNGFENFKRNSLRILKKVEKVFCLDLTTYKRKNGIYYIPEQIADFVVNILVEINRNSLIKSIINSPDQMDMKKQKAFNDEIFSIMKKVTGKEKMPSFEELLFHPNNYCSDPIYNAKAYLEADFIFKEQFMCSIANVKQTTSDINTSVIEFAKQLANIPVKENSSNTDDTTDTNNAVEPDDTADIGDKKEEDTTERYIELMSSITPRDALALIDLLNVFLNNALTKWEFFIEDYKQEKHSIVKSLVYEQGDVLPDDDSKEIIDELLPQNIIKCIQDWEDE